MARDFKAAVLLGVGGGSSIDTAKAIAVDASHPGSAWDYLYFKETQPTEKTLPMIAITTTSGTGSQVTQEAVLTNPALKNKSAIYHDRIYPRHLTVLRKEKLIGVDSQVKSFLRKHFTKWSNPMPPNQLYHTWIQRILELRQGAANYTSAQHCLAGVWDLPKSFGEPEPIAQSWLARQAAYQQQIWLIVDGTKVGFGHQLLMISLAYRRRTVPLAWT